MGELHRVVGNMNATDYVAILNKNIPKTLRKYRLKTGGPATVSFQQDNDPKHWSKAAEAWFLKKRLRCLPWPSYSPDMNIIEHIWDQLDRLICAREQLPGNLEELWKALQEEWTNFPRAALEKLFESMPHRVAALLKAKGGHTKY